jgi:formyl-CoA transferase
VGCGLYATIGILSALRHRDATGEGQHIDVALVDTQISWLINEGVAHLTTGKPRPRRGNEHATIVPYQTFKTSDGHVLVAVGNDSQYARFCDYLGRPDLAEGGNAINANRVTNRDALIAEYTAELAKRTMADVIEGLEARKVPVGPVNTLEQVFATDQVAAREMKIEMACDDVEKGHVSLIGNPLNLSKTPVSYRHAPPRMGQDTDAVLAKLDTPEAD